MKSIELKVVRIGNSRGVRLPAEVLRRYDIGGQVYLEETDRGLLLRPAGLEPTLLSWRQTAQAMAAAAEDWSEWSVADGDGLHGLPWLEAPVRRVAEEAGAYRTPMREGKPR